MLKEFYMWRCRRLSRKLTINQLRVEQITKYKEAKKLNKKG